MSATQEPDDGIRRAGRRELFAACGVAAASGAVGWVAGSATGDRDPAQPTPEATSGPSDATTPVPQAERRDGVTWPHVPQRHALVTVLDLPGSSPEAVRTAVQRALARPAEQSPDAGTVTTTVGFGPRIATALWPLRATGELGMPGFAHDTADLVSGGDLVLQVCAETAAGAATGTAALVASLGAALGEPTLRWRQAGTRDAPTPEGTTRTPAGFLDGIINPRTAEDLTAGVWTEGGHRDTYAVFRRMRIKPSFASLSLADQEAAVGRRRSDGAPLSGGRTMDEVDLFAKTADGRMRTPLAAHARRAHPSNLGRSLMLRRSYAWDPGSGMGLVFIAFMNDPETFVATQRRLDESDALLAHSSADAIGMFFVPGDLSG